MALNQLFRGFALAGSAASSGILRQTAGSCISGCRGMAVYVEVKENRIQQALAELNQKRAEAGIPDELRKRRYHMNGAAQRFEDEKRSYKTAVGQVVKERIKWVMQRRRGNLLE